MSSKSEEKTGQQPPTRLTNRRSFCSNDSNYSNVENLDARKDKGIAYNNTPQSMGNTNQQDSDNDDNKKSWWKRFNPSLTLENKASVARDHLANERTFLAWLRTSLSFISIGIAITQLFRLKPADEQKTNEYDKRGKLMGIIFIILGILFLSFGIARYFHSQYLMTKGHFPASRGSIIIGTMMTVLVLCVVIIINYNLI